MCAGTCASPCATSPSSATTPSATWAAGCASRARVVDDDGDGLVISSIHARGESRTYAKGIVGGASEITLTPEEQEALARRARRTGAVHDPEPPPRPR